MSYLATKRISSADYSNQRASRLARRIAPQITFP
jgi:hypothetical protein